MKTGIRSLLAAGLIGGAALPAAAQDFGFSCLSNNSGSCSSFESQLNLSLSGSGNTVTFTFTNLAGGLASSIADIYLNGAFSFLSALSPVISDSGAGVSFSSGANPGDPPGTGNTWTTSYSADSDSPTQPNGANPGEFVAFTFTGTDLYNQSLSAFGSGGLAAVHLQGLAGGYSETLVTGGSVTPVPEPQTYALMLAGLAVVGFMGRRRNKA